MMIERTNPPQKAASKVPILWVINVILGIVLWFGICSDYSWDNVWANVVFPPIVGLVGLVSFLLGRRSLAPKQKRLQSFFCLPSIVGGIPYLILIVLAIVPPFLLATMFWVDEQSSATLIQSVESPSGSQIAEVYFLPVGAYSGGNGRIEVHLEYKWLPFVKRDIFYLRVTHEDENTDNYLSWVNDETLYIPEKDFKLNIKWIEWELPSIISLPIGVIRLFLGQF